MIVINDTVTWTITIKNNGPDNITNINVTDTLPTGLTDIQTDGTLKNNIVTWNINLNKDETKTLTITAKVIKSNIVLENGVNVKFNGTDPDPTSNNASVNLTVLPDANVTISKIINGSSVVGINDTVTWIITVKHVSGDPLTNVSVSEVLPEGLELIDSTVPEGTIYNETSGIWTIDKLNEINSTYDLVLVTKVLVGGKTITNYVNVTYNGSNSGKNSTNVTLIVSSNADVEVSMDVKPNETQKKV